MAIDKAIFGLRFGANVELYPTRDELLAFLASPKGRGSRETHGGDLAAYDAMLEAIAAFEEHLQRDAGPRDVRQRILYGVQRHCRFFNTALLSDIEFFKYHTNSLLMLDFKKPAAFIRSAEEEMSRHLANKKIDPAKLTRLRNMVSEREQTLAALKKRRAALADELKHIARYIRDNLVKIEKLCETSIVVLVDPKIAKREEKQIIEDIKEFKKEELRNARHQGAITKQHLEAAKQDIDAVSQEVEVLIRGDIYNISLLYEAIYDHAVAFVRAIDALMAEIINAKAASVDETVQLFAQLEQVVVSLISDYRFEPDAAVILRESAHKNILAEKRAEMLDHLFELLHRDRRARQERRADADRRRFKDSSHKDSERRQGNERRKRSSRRTT